jgi:hypothetical protein
MKSESYNGWKNYQTWNVALWIGNNEELYEIAKRERSYGRFVAVLREMADPKDHTCHQIAFETPDNVAWNDSGLDIEALNKMIEEL